MKLVASDMLREIAAEASTAFNNGSPRAAIVLGALSGIRAR